jgi:hypothetical protein
MAAMTSSSAVPRTTRPAATLCASVNACRGAMRRAAARNRSPALRRQTSRPSHVDNEMGSTRTSARTGVASATGRRPSCAATTGASSSFAGTMSDNRVPASTYLASATSCVTRVTFTRPCRGRPGLS